MGRTTWKNTLMVICLGDFETALGSSKSSVETYEIHAGSNRNLPLNPMDDHHLQSFSHSECRYSCSRKLNLYWFRDALQQATGGTFQRIRSSLASPLRWGRQLYWDRCHGSCRAQGIAGTTWRSEPLVLRAVLPDPSDGQMMNKWWTNRKK